jgi:hypothetical protein
LDVRLESQPERSSVEHSAVYSTNVPYPLHNRRDIRQQDINEHRPFRDGDERNDPLRRGIARAAPRPAVQT